MGNDSGEHIFIRKKQYEMFDMHSFVPFNWKYTRANCGPANVRASLSLQSLGSAILNRNDIGIYGIDLPHGGLVGEPYLEEDWNATNILLYNNEKLIINAATRFDVHNHGLEIRLKDGNRFIAGNNIRSFVWTEASHTGPRFFINLKEYKYEQISKTGFFEVLSDGSVSLLKFTFTKIKKPDYNVALNVGSRDAKIYKSSSLYFADEKSLVKLPTSSKKIIKILKAHGFPSNLKPSDVSSEDDLRSVFDLFNKKQPIKN